MTLQEIQEKIAFHGNMAIEQAATYKEIEFERGYALGKATAYSYCLALLKRLPPPDKEQLS